MSRYVKPGVAESALGVDRRTLFKWAQSGDIKFIQPGGAHGQRLYDLNSVAVTGTGAQPVSTSTPPTTTEASGQEHLQGPTTAATAPVQKDYIYARVSTQKQQDDLKTQISTLQAKHPGATVLSDCGSGLNFKRKGLKTLLELAFKGRVRSVHIAHRDRLCRFAYDLVEHVLRFHGAKIVVDSYDPNTTSPELELAEDVLAVVTVFGARLYGKRSAGGRKRKRDAIAALQAAEEGEETAGATSSEAEVVVGSEGGGSGAERGDGVGSASTGCSTSE